MFGRRVQGLPGPVALSDGGAPENGAALEVRRCSRMARIDGTAGGAAASGPDLPGLGFSEAGIQNCLHKS